MSVEQKQNELINKLKINNFTSSEKNKQKLKEMIKLVGDVNKINDISSGYDALPDKKYDNVFLLVRMKGALTNEQVSAAKKEAERKFPEPTSTHPAATPHADPSVVTRASTVADLLSAPRTSTPASSQWIENLDPTQEKKVRDDGEHFFKYHNGFMWEDEALPPFKEYNNDDFLGDKEKIIGSFRTTAKNVLHIQNILNYNKQIYDNIQTFITKTNKLKAIYNTVVSELKVLQNKPANANDSYYMKQIENLTYIKNKLFLRLQDYNKTTQEALNSINNADLIKLNSTITGHTKEIDDIIEKKEEDDKKNSGVLGTFYKALVGRGGSTHKRRHHSKTKKHKRRFTKKSMKKRYNKTIKQ